ncbi:MAG: hypothetical protein BGN86_14205 [Caulobacterales bacterium 68-7]|nr:MAG: hypothetical protein BGN86_14205 [Caulobacterales bacterium 68-7]
MTALSTADAEALARAHALSFDRPWSAEEFSDLLSSPGVFGFSGPNGFILCRAAAGEAEILTLAVDPDARRAGLGRALVELAMNVAALAGAESMFLEVAEDNAPAQALYTAAGFGLAGRRPRYYRRADREIDALVMRRDLNSSDVAPYAGPTA